MLPSSPLCFLIISVIIINSIFPVLIFASTLNPNVTVNLTSSTINSTLHPVSTLVSNNGSLNESTITTTPIPPVTNVTEPSTNASLTTGTSTISVNQRLPQKGSAEEEHHSSMAIFFVLSVIVLCIFVIHFILQTKFHYIPESLAVVLLGALIGLVTKMISNQHLGDWQREEMFNPTTFFLLLLPPIMYESGYNLHKGNFFQNIGSILVFAIVGTTISALVIGGGIYILGLMNAVFCLSFSESFAFGSLISAVDPVATLAIFHALDIDPVLNMLVFGESILNDAVSIVLATTALEAGQSTGVVLSTAGAVFQGVGRFFIVFFGSAAIGATFAFIAALIFKYVDLRKNPSLEFGMMLAFIYAPYGLAEGVHLSGIMAILFNGIVMSHYAHYNLSPVTQITMQQTLRTLAFISETCVFAYLGLALFSFPLLLKPSFIISSVILCLLGRAANIYPLSYFCNYFREHKISKRMMFVMWFSGLRGAVAYAVALHLEIENEKKRVIVTTTLIIVLFTIIFLGGLTMPLMKFLKADKRSISRRGRKSSSSRKITLSKTREMGQTIEADHLADLTEDEIESNFLRNNLSGFVKLDVKYLIPFFTRRFTEQEVKDCRSQMSDLTNRWYQAVRRPSDSEEEHDEINANHLIN
ncbi:LOW QUALITY PROTEIN: sodium/hydrogen exchanger 8-like [Tetranychus urticae]|uniref:LOW QUALITY PROTEIN: sodium/hydrogen exchanger 8-like n=1 Tax=Tetranychus urticae TaxID=32264 RepID=UPI00077BC279|nr:LOW QUALITY PROTEIN: sodium/hydrogen exchanger 8-like [Tetranychus urticae]